MACSEEQVYLIHVVKRTFPHWVDRGYIFWRCGYISRWVNGGYFSGDVATFLVGSTAATFSVGSVSATFSGAATFLGMRFPKNVANYKIGYIFW